MGSGLKTFTGTTLSSSDVNGYLMEQVVITCTSGTRPGTPLQGMHIYETDTDRTLKYTGSAWETLIRVKQDLTSFPIYATGVGAGVTSTVATVSITTTGAALIYAEFATTLTMGSASAGFMNININGTQVRQIRWHSHGFTGLMVPVGSGMLAVAAAGTYSVTCAVMVDVSGTAVTPQEVNYTVREIA